MRAPRRTTLAVLLIVISAVVAYVTLAPPRHAAMRTTPAPTSPPAAAATGALPAAPGGLSPQSAVAGRPAARPHDVGTKAAAAERETEAAGEHISRKDVRALIERTLAGRLRDRELAPADYERLTDDVIRLRAALRAIRHADTSASGGAATEARSTVAMALADIETVTGVPPAELGAVLAPDDDGAAVVGGSPAPR